MGVVIIVTAMLFNRLWLKAASTNTRGSREGASESERLARDIAACRS